MHSPILFVALTGHEHAVELVVLRPDGTSGRIRIGAEGVSDPPLLAEVTGGNAPGLSLVTWNYDRLDEWLRRAGGRRRCDILALPELASLAFPRQQEFDVKAIAATRGLNPDLCDSAAGLCQVLQIFWTDTLTGLRQLHPALLAELDKLLAFPRTAALRKVIKSLIDPRRTGAGVNVVDLFRREQPPRRRHLPQTEERKKLDLATLHDILGPHGTLASQMPGYETRPQQAQMAVAVAEAFNERKHLMVEAGTGIGKSLSYLIPAALWARANGMPVVISTNTRNLQSQLLNKDLPLVQELVDPDLTAVMIKGRRNYLCIRKLLYTLRNAGLELDAAERIALAASLVWAVSSESGDVSECAASNPEAAGGILTHITSLGSECRGANCDHRQRCFLYRARRYAQAADLVIANHSVVLTEMNAGDETPVLPAYRHIIFDEAHNLEAAATSALSIEISTARLHFVTSTLWRPGGRKTGTGPVAVVLNRLKEDHARFLPSHVDRIGAMATAIISGITATHAEVTGLLATLADALAAGGLRESIRIPAERPSVPAWIAVDDKRQQLTATLASLCRHATELRDVLEEVDTAAFDDRNDSIKQLEGAAGELNAYSGDVTLVINAATAGYVFWLERFGREEAALRAWGAPVNVGCQLVEHLFTKKESVILASATLSAGGSMDFMKNRLGLDLVPAGQLEEVILGSPFDYREQCMVMVPTFLPEPDDGTRRYSEELSSLLADVFRITRGRGMVLFTSFDMLRKTATGLRHHMTDHDYTILVHGESGSRETITDAFRSDVSSILLGAQSFWEGVDVVGEALSCLVVARLPFAVFTDPVIEARGKQTEARGGNSFRDYSLPGAILKLRQGFGRLIRHRSDKGIVIIADRRIVSKGYGSSFRKSLPVPTITCEDRDQFLETVKGFFEAG